MAVETKFVVVRKGEEKMTFASKKEADAYDKMLDMAEAFTDWLLESKLQLDEEQAENMALFLAEQKDAVQHILRTSKVPDANAASAQSAAEKVSAVETDEPKADAAKANAEESGKKIRAVKAA
ncbi:YebG family protein [Rouxiella chamberiensis]|uniref:YebG family protein n=1 Tax=Rouxiella chamberiensis TaxID=1513468 RepID=UPI0005D39846|nr:YebG family protein [Rouxiella chamberiensis]